MPFKKKVQDQPVVEVDFAEQEQRLAKHMQRPRLGQIVGYVLPRNGSVRPAIVVEIWEKNIVNLQVFMDGRNDGAMENTMWTKNVSQDENFPFAPTTWHYL